MKALDFLMLNTVEPTVCNEIFRQTKTVCRSVANSAGNRSGWYIQWRIRKSSGNFEVETLNSRDRLSFGMSTGYYPVFGNSNLEFSVEILQITIFIKVGYD